MYEENYTYKSSTEFCIKQKKQLLDELENEAFLARASRFATGQTKSKIGDGINGIVVELDNKIKNATNSDAANKNEIEKKIKAIDDKVIELNQTSTQKKEEPKAKPASEIAETKTEPKTETKPETKKEKKKGKKVLGIVAALVALIVIATSVFGVYGYSKAAKEVKNVQVGSIIEFGNYGGEKITWRVLDVVDGKAFVVAEDAVDLGYFNETNEAVIWEDSDIRNFLNDSFYSSAFGLFEKNRILNTNNVSNTLTSTKITTDKVFLLSAGEVESYLAGKIKKTTCSPNSYAASKGIDFDNNKCWYWLRDTGMEDYRALVVVSDGSKNVWGFEVAAPDGGIRPAMWIKIS